MYRAILIVSVLLGAVALLLGAGNPAVAGEPCTVSIIAPAEVVTGSEFTVSVDVADIATLDAGQFDVTFDESLLQLEDVTAGQVGEAPIPVDLWSRVGTGTYRIILNVPGVPGVSGSGSLAILHFHAASSAAGSTTLTPSNGFLNSNLGAEIAATWAGDSLSVLDGPGAPTPSAPGGPADTTATPGGTPTWAWALAAFASVVAVGVSALFITNSRKRP